MTQKILVKLPGDVFVPYYLCNRENECQVYNSNKRLIRLKFVKYLYNSLIK